MLFLATCWLLIVHFWLSITVSNCNVVMWVDCVQASRITIKRKDANAPSSLQVATVCHGACDCGAVPCVVVPRMYAVITFVFAFTGDINTKQY